MRYNRNKWKFIIDKHNIRVNKTLSVSDVRYWKDTLSKIVKVGIEFELNLPKGSKGCAGTDIKCPCRHLMVDNCWATCANVDRCKNTAELTTCANRTEACKAEDCTECANYVFKCIGLYCNEFIPICINCTKFERACDTCNKYKKAQMSPADVRKALITAFSPSKSYDKVGTGVVDITKDGSLISDGGVEIVTVGRRINYFEFYNMAKRILDEACKYGAYVNERCGAHMHVLTTHYNNINELERPVPEIILANFHQLVRKYQNALTWLTMALDKPNHMTRWEKFRVSVLPVSPIKYKMQKVAMKVDSIAGGRKYGFVNYNNCMFDKAGDVTLLHIEFREADATLCPSIYAALACLHFAFVIKAVEISKYGLLVVGDSNTTTKINNMKNKILNGAERGYNDQRVSDTSSVLDYTDYFIEEAIDMLAQMKNILIKIGPAYEVLEKLAYKPVALRRIEGDSWDTIEKDLEVTVTDVDDTKLKIDEIIDLRLIDNCTDINEWITNVTKIINESMPNEEKITIDFVTTYIDEKRREGTLLWSNQLGTVIAI